MEKGNMKKIRNVWTRPEKCVVIWKTSINKKKEN